MLKYLKNIFKKDNSDKCLGCSMFDSCTKRDNKKNINKCDIEEYTAEHMFKDDVIEYTTHGKVLYFDEIDKTKDSILIVEDNEGVTSFLKEDLDYLDKIDVINKDDYNILTFSGPLAAFDFEVSQEKSEGFNVKYAILDITLGGSIMTEEGNIKYTGVDVYKMLIKYNPDVKFVFYTGNSLNPYIKVNKRIIELFHELTNKDIMDYVLFKASLDMDLRRKYLKDNLFNKDKE